MDEISHFYYKAAFDFKKVMELISSKKVSMSTLNSNKNMFNKKVNLSHPSTLLKEFIHCSIYRTTHPETAETIHSMPLTEIQQTL